MNPYQAMVVLWWAWIISWWAAAFWRDRAVKRPPAVSEILYRVLVIVGVLLMFVRFQSPWMSWTLRPALQWVMVALEAIGFLFTWWARVTLGKLWSSSITRKADHHVVDTGAYAIVRHPIYTGVILAETASAVLIGSVLALAGAALMFVGWYVKARMEEGFLRQELDRDAYDAYARRVPMLVPFLLRS